MCGKRTYHLKKGAFDSESTNILVKGFNRHGLESISIGNNLSGWSYCLSVNWESYEV